MLNLGLHRWRWWTCGLFWSLLYYWSSNDSQSYCSIVLIWQSLTWCILCKLDVYYNGTHICLLPVIKPLSVLLWHKGLEYIMHPPLLMQYIILKLSQPHATIKYTVKGATTTTSCAKINFILMCIYTPTGSKCSAGNSFTGASSSCSIQDLVLVALVVCNKK